MEQKIDKLEIKIKNIDEVKKIIKEILNSIDKLNNLKLEIEINQNATKIEEKILETLKKQEN